MSRIDPDLGGASVEHRAGSSAPPVMLLHSSGGSGAQWRRLAERLGASFRVAMPDLCGYGTTPHWGGRGRFTLAHEAALVGAWIERMDEPVHLVGHSYGGAVALHIARMAGPRVASLSLFEPVAFHVLDAGDVEDRAALRDIVCVAARIHESLASGDYAAGAAHFVDYWSGVGSWAVMPAVRQDAFAARLPKVALDFQATLHEPARASDLRGIEVPTLLMQGGRSPLSVRRIVRRLAQVLPRCKVDTLAEAGHMAPLTHRDAVDDRIEAHLASCRELARRPGSLLASL
jgi:pimeloyl-ACP methyl ester carboxylesterase